MVTRKYCSTETINKAREKLVLDRMKDFSIWSFARQKLSQDIPVVLLIVASHRGSSPGRQGFKMIISAGDQTGSVGGGIMEQNMIQLAKEILIEKSEKPIKRIQDHSTRGPPDQQSGLMCSGSQTNILIYLSREEHFSLLSSIIVSYESNADDFIKINQDGFTYEKDQIIVGDIQFRGKEDWEYIEKVGDPYIVHMFGGGHVGYAITRVLSTLDFYIRLYDNREDMDMIQKNPYPQQKIIGEYAEIAKGIHEGRKSFVIIATFSRIYDAEVLAEVVHKDLGYLGVMGSKTKIKNIFNKMKNQGVSKELLDRVSAPIGIPIGDESAEEIAISIVAQLIQYKNTLMSANI